MIPAEIPAKDISLTFMKGMSVLRTFDESHSQLTLADIARLTGIERAAVRRLVLTLVYLGYVRKDGTRFWCWAAASCGETSLADWFNR